MIFKDPTNGDFSPADNYVEDPSGLANTIWLYEGGVLYRCLTKHGWIKQKIKANAIPFDNARLCAIVDLIARIDGEQA